MYTCGASAVQHISKGSAGVKILVGGRDAGLMVVIQSPCAARGVPFLLVGLHGWRGLKCGFPVYPFCYCKSCVSRLSDRAGAVPKQTNVIGRFASQLVV